MTWLYIPNFIEICSGVSEPQGVKIWPFSLLWLLAFTTACTTVQAVISQRYRHGFYLFIYLLIYKNKNWLQFLFFVKAAASKQQISKFYLQIQRTEAMPSHLSQSAACKYLI